MRPCDWVSQGEGEWVCCGVSMRVLTVVVRRSAGLLRGRPRLFRCFQFLDEFGGFSVELLFSMCRCRFRAAMRSFPSATFRQAEFL